MWEKKLVVVIAMVTEKFDDIYTVSTQYGYQHSTDGRTDRIGIALCML